MLIIIVTNTEIQYFCKKEKLMIELGIKGHQETIVTMANVASTVGSGRVSVFATPMMIALMEKAAAISIEPYLSEGQSSVGTSICVTHVSATPIGMKVWADTEIIGIDRRKITFSVKAYDESGLIGEGTHDRFIIDVDKFKEKAYKKL